MPLGFLGGKRYIFAVYICVFSHSYILVSFNSICTSYIPILLRDSVLLTKCSCVSVKFSLYSSILTTCFEVIWHVTIHYSWDFIFLQCRISLMLFALNSALSNTLYCSLLLPFLNIMSHCFVFNLCKNASCKQHMVFFSFLFIF